MMAPQGQIKAEVSDVNTVVITVEKELCLTVLCLSFIFIYYFIPQH